MWEVTRAGIFRQIIRRYANRSCEKPKRKCTKKEVKHNKGRAPAGCVDGPSGVYPAHEGGFKIWRSIALFLCFPLIGFVAYNTLGRHHKRPRQPYVQYEFMYRRTKTFPWGTNKSLFHNPRRNALPDGYECEEEEEEEGEED